MSTRILTWPELAYRLTHCDECYCRYGAGWPGCPCPCHEPADEEPGIPRR